MLDKQLEEYNKQKEEEQQKEEELNKANSISTLNNLGDTVNIDLKDEKYNNVYDTTDYTGTYPFKLIYKSTNSIVSGTVLGLLCTKSIVNINGNKISDYSFSANLKDTNNNLYQFTELTAPTKDQINKSPSNDNRKTGFKYWTSTNNNKSFSDTDINGQHTYVAADGRVGDDMGGFNNQTYALLPYIELTLK